MWRPFCENSIPTSRKSSSITGVSAPPSTISALEPLSATVSSSLICQSRTRESTISSAGITPSVADRTLVTVTPGPGRSSASTNAISPSQRGASNMSVAIASPAGTIMSSKRWP